MTDRLPQVFPLTCALGEFAARPGDIPDLALQTARIGLTDAIGVMLAGRSEPVLRALYTTLDVERSAEATGLVQVLGTKERARALDAALLNGTAAHALAMDDVAAGCHPSSMLMAALVCQAQLSGHGGLDILRAYVVGYEILAELAGREPDALHRSGWHPSAVLGPVAVAGAVAHLMGLDGEACAHALGMAASMTGELVANFGTGAKPLHIGRAAQAGLLAARMAAAGVTAAQDALESKTGLLSAISPSGRVDLTREPACLNDLWHITRSGISIKQYPVCYSTHRVVDAAITVAGLPGFAVENIQRIEVSIGATQAWMARHHRPLSVPEAKYSVEFAVASGLIARAAGFAQLNDTFIQSEAVQRLIGATDLALSDDVSEEDAVFSPFDHVAVQLTDGARYDSGPVRYARGNAKLAMTDVERHRKFVDCARHGGYAEPEALWSRLESLATLNCLEDLFV
ncbi:MmgE/PrpD family protein [Paraburkholderia fynbosensis]|nr:MmgE/PrpD family protein [Paraburkholderia fynbosensis]